MDSNHFRYFLGVFSILCIAGLSQGKVGFGPGEQDWGLIDVRPGAHMFYWLYYTTANVTSFYDRPIVIWLQGGPGSSGTGFGNFEELGPLTLELEERPFTWVKDYNVVFIDNPVGSGFSYVDSEDLLTKTNQEIADDLLVFIKEFYVLYPEFQAVDLHIMTESYGGKMGADFAYSLDSEIKSGNIDCKLKSVTLIDAWISPIDSMNSWAPYLLNIGAVDRDGHDRIAMTAMLIENAFIAGKFVDATNLFGLSWFATLDETFGIDIYNVQFKKEYSEKLKSFRMDPEKSLHRTLVEFDEDDILTLDELMNGPIREALDIPDSIIWGGQSGATFKALNEDFMKPVTDVIELLLNNTQIEVICITGQLDLIVATPGTVMWVDRLKFAEKAEYVSFPRAGMAVDGILEGYYKKAGRFSMYWVNRSGHMVPADNPAAMKYILDEIIPV